MAIQRLALLHGRLMEQRLLVDRVATPIGDFVIVAEAAGGLCAAEFADHGDRLQRSLRLHYGAAGFSLAPAKDPAGLATRSEERRVGKECVRTGRSRWSPNH